MFRGESVFICPKCGKKFVAPDIELGATAKSQPIPCPHCGTLTDKKSIIPTSLFKWFNRLGDNNTFNKNNKTISNGILLDVDSLADYRTFGIIKDILEYLLTRSISNVQSNPIRTKS